jgi:hypothetical protein
MKKLFFKISGLAILFILSLGLQEKVLASSYSFVNDSGLTATGNSAGYQTTVQAPEQYVGLILNIVFSLVGMLFLGLVVYSGINWMLADGNSAKIDTAKDTLLHSAVGLIIVIAAYAITYFVLNYFTGTPGA